MALTALSSAQDEGPQHSGMTLIITALQLEAQPWIQHFRLKKDPHSKRIPMYKAEHCQLAISGVGAVPAAIATSLLLSQIEPSALHQAHLFNIGLCGSLRKEQVQGSVLLGNCIQDATTGRTFISDILTRHPFPESRITTVAQPVNKHTSTLPLNTQTVFEMEAAGIYQAAGIFLAPHQLHFLKIVSDHLEGELLNKSVMTQFLGANVEPIAQYITAVHNMPTTQPFALDAKQTELTEILITQLKLTQTQSIQLKEAAKACAFRSPARMLSICHDFAERCPQDKKERSAILRELVMRLYE